MQMRWAESFLMSACNLRWHLSPLPLILSPKWIHQVIFSIIQRHHFMAEEVMEWLQGRAHKLTVGRKAFPLWKWEIYGEKDFFKKLLLKLERTSTCRVLSKVSGANSICHPLSSLMIPISCCSYFHLRRGRAINISKFLRWAVSEEKK